jgi:hypothetical protein
MSSYFATMNQSIVPAMGPPGLAERCCASSAVRFDTHGRHRAAGNGKDCVEQQGSQVPEAVSISSKIGKEEDHEREFNARDGST